MYVIGYYEHITALEGLGQGSELGPRTGKMGPEILALFQNLEDAMAWCRKCQEKWCKATKKDPGVLTWWYEIWDYPVLLNLKDDGRLSPNFVAAFNRYGKQIEATWTLTGQIALDSEPKKRRGKK